LLIKNNQFKNHITVLKNQVEMQNKHNIDLRISAGARDLIEILSKKQFPFN
jgi:hypothetical protein